MRDRLLAGIFVALVALPVPLDRLLAARGVEPPGRPFARSLGAISWVDDLRDGDAGRKIENRLVNRSHFARWLTVQYSELSYLAFRRTPQGVRVGRDSWLFVSDRVSDRSASHWQTLLRDNARTIAGVGAAIRARGGRLIVGIVPDRARLHPERAYRSGRMPEGRRAFLPALEAALRERGVEVVSLEEPLRALRATGREPVYRDDHHWTSTGAQRAARTLATAATPRRAGLPRPVPYELRWDLQAESPGSLIRKLGFAPGSPLEAAFRGAEPRLRLLDDGPVPGELGWSESCATYWTTSFGDLGSPYVFANTLGCPVRVGLARGKGSGAAPRADLERLRAEHPDLDRYPIVWEIPEYHLVSPVGGRPSYGVELDGVLPDAP